MLLSHTVTKDILQPGDHVYVWMAGGAYAHHGIVAVVAPCPADCRHCGSCVSVVHFAPPPEVPIAQDPNATLVRITSLAAFTRGRRLALCKYGVPLLEMRLKRPGTCSDDQADPRHRIVLRALSLVGWGAGQFNLLTRNCEVICRWCVLGSRPSLPDPRDRPAAPLGQWQPAAPLLSVLSPQVTGVFATAAIAAVALANWAAPPPDILPPQEGLDPEDHQNRIPEIVEECLRRSLALTVPPAVRSSVLNQRLGGVFLSDLLATFLMAEAPRARPSVEPPPTAGSQRTSPHDARIAAGAAALDERQLIETFLGKLETSLSP